VLAGRPASCVTGNLAPGLPLSAMNGELLVALLLGTAFVRRLRIKAASIANTNILQAIVGYSSYDSR